MNLLILFADESATCSFLHYPTEITTIKRNNLTVKIPPTNQLQVRRKTSNAIYSLCHSAVYWLPQINYACRRLYSSLIYIIWKYKVLNANRSRLGKSTFNCLLISRIIMSRVIQGGNLVTNQGWYTRMGLSRILFGVIG